MAVRTTACPKMADTGLALKLTELVKPLTTCPMLVAKIEDEELGRYLARIACDPVARALVLKLACPLVSKFLPSRVAPS